MIHDTPAAPKAPPSQQPATARPAAASEAVLAVDIGGTKIAAAMVRDGAILERAQCPTPRVAVGATLVPAVHALVAPWLARASAVGAATTGFVMDGRVSAVNSATLPLPDGFEIERLLAEALGLTPVVVNDAQAATWGEYCFGSGAGTRDFAFLTVSTGVGGGLVGGGQLISGRRGFAGHLGHTVVQLNGPACGCGRRGCVEALASGRAIAERAAAVRGAGTDAAALLAAAGGNAACRAIVEDAANAVAQLCLDLVAALDLERIALGGGVGLNPLFRQLVREAIDAAPALFRVPLVAPALGADAGLVGAAALASSQSAAPVARTPTLPPQ
jgi:N-acylmannosamine kinase